MGRLLLQDRNILMVSARRGSERDRRSGRSHESVRTKESTDAAPSRWRQACPNGPERLLACSALAGVLLALVMLQAGCVLAVGDQPGAWEEVELFAVRNPSSSYYRGSLPIAAGDGTLVFEVVAGKAAEGGWSPRQGTTTGSAVRCCAAESWTGHASWGRGPSAP